MKAFALWNLLLHKYTYNCCPISEINELAQKTGFSDTKIVCCKMVLIPNPLCLSMRSKILIWVE